MQTDVGRETEECASIDEVTADEYAASRADYVKSGKGTPPPGAEPLPPAGKDGELPNCQEPTTN
jgi:hypothetical protein